MNEVQSTNESEGPNWRPLDEMQRRVLGVLVEKAKTTPDAYPLTVNAIKTASNQKSNRSPKMDLAADDVMATLDELREMGAVAEIQGDGRAEKYRHLAYDWLGVDQFELAVMTELMLRGQQTVGELRARAARMEPIAGMSELKPILASLKQKRLLVELTPPGRGQTVTHGLFLEGEQPVAAVPPAATIREPAAVSGQTVKSPADGGQESALEKRVAELERRLSELESRLTQ